jgi:aryl-alcohol dehydrogenase-like predicted oxidoreductase
MEYRVLGRTGVKVSSLCLGTANFPSATPIDEAKKIIVGAINKGINFIDTAESYSNGESERIIGQTLSEHGLRHQVILATKVGLTKSGGPNESGNSRLHIIKACENSLRRLNTDYIDLYQIHRPSFDIPADETLSALTDLVHQGKVCYIGCSTYPAWKIMESRMVSELKGYSKFISEQPPYNLLDRSVENEVLPVCRAYGLAIIPWSPMAMGILAGRYKVNEGFPPTSRAARWGGIYAERVTQNAVIVGNKFVELANQLGYSPAQLAILWVKDQPGITSPIIGPRDIEQMNHLLKVMEMHLDDSVRVACDGLVPPGSSVANFHNTSGWMKMHI